MLTRRGFLQALGIGAAATVLPALPEPESELLEPRRKLWAVPSNAPVGSRIERAGGVTLSSYANSFKQRYGKFIEPLPSDATLAQYAGLCDSGYTYDTGEAFSLNDIADSVRALEGNTLRMALPEQFRGVSADDFIFISGTAPIVDNGRVAYWGRRA